MGGLIRKALIYFSFYIRSLDLVVAKRNFITSALVKCREHAMMKPALWSVAGNLPFLRDVRFSYQVFVPSFLFFGQRSEIYVGKISRLLWTHFFFLVRFFKVLSKYFKICLIFNCSFYKKSDSIISRNWVFSSWLG